MSARDRSSAGLPLVGWGFAIAVVASLIGTIANQLAWDQLAAGDYTSTSIDSILETVRLIGWARMGVYACTSAMVILGCAMLASSPAPRVRGWALAAASANGLHLACSFALTLMNEGSGVSQKTYELVILGAELTALVGIVALGLALRHLIESRGGRISSLVWAIAIGGLVWSVATVLVDLGWPSWMYEDETRRWLIFGVSTAVAASQAALVFAARAAIQRVTTMSTTEGSGIGSGSGSGQTDDDGQRPLEGEGWTAAAEGLSLYRGALIARLVITCITLGMVGWVLLTKNPKSIQGLMLILPLAELVASLVMLVGLVRYSSNLPVPAASGPAVGGLVCFVLAGLVQLYAYSIVWRMHSFQQKAERATSMWDMPSIGDLMDKAETLPWIEMLATIAGLIGLLLVLSSLKTLARWIGNHGLERAAGGLAVGMALLTIFAGGVRWYIATARRPSVGLVLMLGLIGLIWGLAMIIQYIGLLRDLVQVMMEGQPTIPTARLAGGGGAAGGAAPAATSPPPSSSPPPPSDPPPE